MLQLRCFSFDRLYFSRFSIIDLCNHRHGFVPGRFHIVGCCSVCIGCTFRFQIFRGESGFQSLLLSISNPSSLICLNRSSVNTSIIAPQWNGVSCEANNICVEILEQADDAQILYNSAIKFVNQSVGEIKQNPRVTFCSSIECFNAFGFHAPAKAKTIGLSGIVVGPAGWQNHILRHEMIHHLQAEKLGVIGQWLSPMWFKEGMAYSPSMDPRKLSSQFESYRNKFENWYLHVGKENAWQAAKKL